jgi:hypothetical protein
MTSIAKKRVGIRTDIIELGTAVSEIQYTPKPIDEYQVLVNLPEDWDEVHNFIINENEIDGIPNRRIDCINEQKFSLRGAIYEMSVEEAEILRTHEKVESVTLNPDKYVQPVENAAIRFKGGVPHVKSLITFDVDGAPLEYNNDIQGNWANVFVNDPENFPKPYQGVGITTNPVFSTKLDHSYTGKNVDAITIDTGAGVLHPEFIDENGVYRMKDVVIDGPYYIDPAYFNSNGYTYTKVLSGQTIGVGIATDKAREWWTDSTKRSAEFQSLGTISSIGSDYTYAAGMASNTHTSDPNPITDSHGTSCASQIGGKGFGLAYRCNLWSIRVNLGDGFTMGASTALDVSTIFHQAKKISQAGNVNPTIINNSWGSTLARESIFPKNTNGTTYTVNFRGNITTYTGTGTSSPADDYPANARGFYQSAAVRYTIPDTIIDGINYGGGGTYYLNFGRKGFNNPFATTSNSAAENAIAAGCIVVAAGMNENHKMSDRTDPDFNNYFNFTNWFSHRCGGVQQGFSGLHDKGKGTIRIGALDCAVEPASDGVTTKQGSTRYSIRKVCYSAGGPMIDIFSPGEMTQAAGYASSEDYEREDDPNFYDTLFNGTSAACPNAVGLMCLYLEYNREATQQDVRNWLTTVACKDGLISDPYPGIDDVGYWSEPGNDTYDLPTKDLDSYNVRGSGSLKGAPNKVTYNPYASNKSPSFTGIKISGIRFQQS